MHRLETTQHQRGIADTVRFETIVIDSCTKNDTTKRLHTIRCTGDTSNTLTTIADKVSFFQSNISGFPIGIDFDTFAFIVTNAV